MIYCALISYLMSFLNVHRCKTISKMIPDSKIAMQATIVLPLKCSLLMTIYDSCICYQCSTLPSILWIYLTQPAEFP